VAKRPIEQAVNLMQAVLGGIALVAMQPGSVQNQIPAAGGL
jgi:hypothetical protein